MIASVLRIEKSRSGIVTLGQTPPVRPSGGAEVKAFCLQ